MMIKRRKTRQVKVGGVKIGGGAPVSIQSMTNTVTGDVAATVSQVKKLERAGCEIVRVAVRDERDAAAVRRIKNRIKIPLVCDIHFNYRLALKCIVNGADKIRLNPGNINKRDEVAAVVKACSRARIPIRVGVNSGSVSTQYAIHNTQYEPLVKSALGYIKVLESCDFHDIIISLKSSDVVSTIESYRKIAGLCDYPLHLGVTATGPYSTGIVKSSVGIGTLLAEGIGDTIRVSLTADPVEEVFAAKKILGAVGARSFGPDIISCPTCGRCKVDLIAMVEKLEKKMSDVPPGLSARRARGRCQMSEKKPVKIAMMGCEVNGPGEAKEADIGIAFGKDSGVLFKKGKIVKKIKAKDAISEILKAI